MSEPFEARKEAAGGWCVIGPDFYLHHASQDICEAMAALLNAKVTGAAPTGDSKSDER